jgi:hypothetical protein
MVDLPREARLALFPKFLRRGAVIRVDQYPFLYEGPKDKFLVLLNRQFDPDRPLYCILTTSRTEALPFPALTVVLPAGTVSFFPLATALQCRGIHCLDFGFLAQRYAAGRLTFVGELPPAITNRLDEILAVSPYLAPAIVREILPPAPE